MNGILIMQASSPKTYSKNNKHFYKNSQEYKLYSEPTMDVYQLQYFKEQTSEEIKLLIFKILKELPTDVHLPILTIIDQYEEWRIIEAIINESSYEYSSSELSDPEEEYERQLVKTFSNNWWYGDSGNETD